MSSNVLSPQLGQHDIVVPSRNVIKQDMGFYELQIKNIVR